MKARTVLIVLAVVAVAFVATNCLAATVDANKPGDANKPADINKPGKTTVSVVDFSKYTEYDKFVTVFGLGQSTTDNTFTKFERPEIVCYDFSKMVIVK